MSACPHCGAERETLLGCAACGVLFSPEPEPTPFEVLGLEPRMALDPGLLRRRLLAHSRLMHPDFFADASAEQRALAERNSALMNRAFETLSDDVARADWLIGQCGGPREGELRDMPKAFLMEVLEWNEALEEARAAAPGAPERERLSDLRSTLAEARRSALGRLQGLLDPLPEATSPALADARRELNALRYLRRTLDQIEALRLEQASSR